MVRRPPLTVETRVHSQTVPSVVCSLQIGTWAGCSQKIAVFTRQHHVTALIHLPTTDGVRP